jgi:purine-binding chemotaxis protein CheW
VFAAGETNARRGWLVDDVDVARTVQTDGLEPPRTTSATRFINGRLEIAGSDAVWLDERAING